MGGRDGETSRPGSDELRLVTDSELRITAADDAAVRLLGYARDELLRMTIRDLRDPATLGDFDVRVRAQREHHEARFETRYRRRDGTTFPVEVEVRLSDVGGSTSLVGTVRDLTGRKRAEESLRISEERLRLAVEATSEVVWDWDVVHDRIEQNPRWAELLGYPPELTPRSMAELSRFVHPDDQSLIQRQVSTAISGACDDVLFEHRLRAASGEWRWMLARARIVERDREGHGIRIVGTCADVTVQKRAEEALKDVERRREAFLAVLSHELRNPLSAARNASFVLAHAAPGSAQAQGAHAIIDRQLGQLTRLVEDLLDVSRITSGKIQLQKRRIDLGDLARRSADENRYAFVARGVELRVEVPTEPLWVDCDATRIVQVVGNLLQNAAKFTPRGQVVLAVDVEPPRTARIRVRDTGVGIVPELRPRLFRPFEQADATLSRPYGGLGLGLALVKGLTELHGGTVDVASAGVGAGSEFVVRLPAAEAGPQVCATAWRPARALRVLAIEDDGDAAFVLGELLGFLGHRADIAHDGPEGLERMRRAPPDLVLCDIGLPGMSGYEVAREVRADPLLRETTLVALTGYASPADIQRAAEAGFDRHLAKPIAPDDLARALDEVAQAAPSRDASVHPSGSSPAGDATAPAG